MACGQKYVSFLKTPGAPVIHRAATKSGSAPSGPAPEEQFRLGLGFLLDGIARCLAGQKPRPVRTQWGAWITEKFGEWTDNGLPDEAVDRDQLLTNVTLYWLTGTAGSSARLYYETARARAWNPTARSTVPTGVAVFPREIVPPIRRFAEQSDTIVHWTEFGRGGHFAAMEVPDLLVGDVREFFRPLRRV